MKTRIIGAIVALMLAGVGAFVLIAYVRGADARAADGAITTDVYVVEEAIPEGTAGGGIEDYVKIDSVPQRNAAVGAVTDLEELAGLVTDASILPGEQLLEARFIDPLELAARGDVPVPAGMQLVSFTLPADRVVGGAIAAGDHIGMVGTVPGRTVRAGVHHRTIAVRVQRRARDARTGCRASGIGVRSGGGRAGPDRRHHAHDRALHARCRALGVVHRG